MNMIDFSIEEEKILSHKDKPTFHVPERNMGMKKMPDLHWIKITSLGFGQESDDEDDSAFHEIDRAAKLFAASGVSFSLLCERTHAVRLPGEAGMEGALEDSSRSNDDKIVFAVGFEDEHTASGILRAAFGTVFYESYTPSSQWRSGSYAKAFDVIRADTNVFDNREAASAIHAPCWVDEITRILMSFPGMVRLDFQPISANAVKDAIDTSREIQDSISAYLETNTSVSSSISYDPRDHAVENVKHSVFGEKDKYNHSSDGSISWKNADSALETLKKEEEYYSQLLYLAQKDGWCVDFTVSADLGVGEVSSSVKLNREHLLLVPISTMIITTGYTCSWDRYSEAIQKSDIRGLIVTSPTLIDYISFPTTSSYGFERVTNRYYNVNLNETKGAIPIAQLLQFGNDTGIRVSLPQDQINRHIFVCGMTGSGKTNTVHQLLSGVGDLPFLVIEPVKGEYSSLPGVITYTMTAGSKQALSLNPFWFPEESNLQYHIDCLKQIISSAFDLYAAMPNILEQCLNNVYQHCGWDIVRGSNFYASELPEYLLYPTFSDLCREVENYIDNSKFGEETKANYRGALLSRLQSFTSGTKGLLLNTTESISYEHFESDKIVISLDSLADDADKSIVMGVILAQYYQYLKVKCRNSERRGLKHITVIEEAHHLFAADVSAAGSHADGGSGQNSSRNFVKTLNNMLAEIRAYGEGFIIVDQSPSALHPAVLKNTGVKIVHRVDYGEDIETIQEVLLLDKNDHELAALTPGQALMRFGGMRTPSKIYIPCCETKENAAIIPAEEISGDSLISHLLEDQSLKKAIVNIVKRLLNHLLYDNLSNFHDIYQNLCLNIDRELVLSGHTEIVMDSNRDSAVIKYIDSFVPGVIEKMLPMQYGTAKIIAFFASRFLMLINESENDLSGLEIAAFEDYRRNRIWPRMSQYWKHSSSKLIEDALFILHDALPETGLVSDIAKDLIDNSIGADERELAFDELLIKRYFFAVPDSKPELFSYVVCLLEYYNRRKA